MNAESGRQRSLFEEPSEGRAATRSDSIPVLTRGLAQRLELERLLGARHIARSDPAQLLGDIADRVRVCQKCHLWKTRRNAVPGQGNAKAQLVFIGEAPGEEEDKQGEAFVGRAGQLLTKIINSINLQRADVFISNVIKCRPPGNRTPLPDEIATCLPYLLAQCELINPRIICALGAVAVSAILGRNEPIGRIRGKFIPLGGAKLIATYHPAYLLRNPSEKKTVWEDMQKIRDELLRWSLPASR